MYVVRLCRCLRPGKSRRIVASKRSRRNSPILLFEFIYTFLSVAALLPCVLNLDTRYPDPSCTTTEISLPFDCVRVMGQFFFLLWFFFFFDFSFRIYLFAKAGALFCIFAIRFSFSIFLCVRRVSIHTHTNTDIYIGRSRS